jgi:eukaryotic-like serine/threonine-protein kinase
VLSRIGWAAAAVATVVLLAPDRPGTAVIVVAAALSAALVRGTGRAWALPAAAPLLGFAGLATAYPALAGRARAAWQRAALGAVGALWLLLAEALLDRRLQFAAERLPRTDARAAFDDVISPLFSSGLILVAAVWALAALVLPWLVRGRYGGADLVAATVWATALGSGTAAVAEWAGAGQPRGVVAGAIAAGVLALLAPRLLPRDIVGS